jgi:hypothetical protein
MKTNLMLATMLTAGLAMAQVMVPDGTKVRVRLEQNLSSETAEMGQTVDFVVTQEVRVGDAVVVANGARATGSIVEVEPKRRLGRAGKLDFSIDRVQLVDGNWLSVRYTPQKNKGKGNGVATGVLTAGLAVVFWPAAPLGLLIKGHEATIIKGRTYEIFSDDSVYVSNAMAASTPMMTRVMPQAQAMMIRQANGAPMNNGGLPAGVTNPGNQMLVSNVSMTNMPEAPAPAGAVQPQAQAQGTPATLAITSNQPGADIEVDGMFVGSAPTTIQIAPGVHKLTVKDGTAIWQREIQISGGTVNITANLTKPGVRLAAK